jgi:hypothetical protein
VAAAFAFGFGAIGYPLALQTALPAWAIILIAVGGGALVISGMILLLAQWALRATSAQLLGADDEIQGQLATVSREIAAAGTGEISYDRLGKPLQVPARALSSNILPVGAEVVIDRIENGVAFVEEWATVEQRL